MGLTSQLQLSNISFKIVLGHSARCQIVSKVSELSLIDGGLGFGSNYVRYLHMEDWDVLKCPVWASQNG